MLVIHNFSEIKNLAYDAKISLKVGNGFNKVWSKWEYFSVSIN